MVRAQSVDNYKAATAISKYYGDILQAGAGVIGVSNRCCREEAMQVK